jgi:hypothetical protein
MSNASDGICFYIGKAVERLWPGKTFYSNASIILEIISRFMDCVGNPDARECLQQVYAERPQRVRAVDQMINW